MTACGRRQPIAASSSPLSWKRRSRASWLRAPTRPRAGLFLRGRKRATNPRVSARSQRGQVLPDDACPACGTSMAEKRGKLRLPVNGEDITVPSAAHLKCPRCHEVELRSQDTRRLSEDAIASYRLGPYDRRCGAGG